MDEGGRGLVKTHLAILGSTGSIGGQALEVVGEHQADFKVEGLAAGNNISFLKDQIKKFSPKAVSVFEEKEATCLRRHLGRSAEIFWGEEGNIAVATLSGVERVVVATPGFFGIRPTLAAIKKKKTICLATKEVLVAAGEIVMREAKKQRVSVLPVDSEHSAIFQCLAGHSKEEISRIYLTCSGGPFRGKKIKDLKKVGVKEALRHPNWKMGRKITVDSATLMNKGFEVMEAMWLFGVPIEKITVIVHPQSVVHSAVEFVDGSILAQMGPADMRLPIQYALFYPDSRLFNHFKRFSFADFPSLTFEEPDTKTFRCLVLALAAAKAGGMAPAVLNAANDVAVAAFLAGRIGFLQIAQICEKTLEHHKSVSGLSLSAIFAADAWAREYAGKLILNT